MTPWWKAIVAVSHVAIVACQPGLADTDDETLCTFLAEREEHTEITRCQLRDSWSECFTVACGEVDSCGSVDLPEVKVSIESLMDADRACERLGRTLSAQYSDEALCQGSDAQFVVSCR